MSQTTSTTPTEPRYIILELGGQYAVLDSRPAGRIVASFGTLRAAERAAAKLNAQAR